MRFLHTSPNLIGAHTMSSNCMQICPSFLLKLPFIPWCCCFLLTTCSTALPTITRAATRAHTHTHTHSSRQAHTHTRTHAPQETNLPTSYLSFRKLVLLCSPSSAFSCLSSAAEKGHICLKALLGRNQPVQNKGSRGCLNLGTRQPVAIFKLVLSPPSEGTLLCFSLSLSLPVQLLHNTHQLFIACLPVSRQNQSQMESC